MDSKQKVKESKYLYELDSLKKDEPEIIQNLYDIHNYIKDDDIFAYDKEILEKKNFIITPNSIERIRKISFYISRDIPLIIKGPSGVSKTISTELACILSKAKRPIIEFNITLETTPSRKNNFRQKFISSNITPRRCFLKSF